MIRLQNALLAATLLLCSVTTVHAAESRGLSPNLVVADAVGEAVPLSKFAGKVVYLDIWASWCSTCANSLSWMSELQKKYGSKGFQVVALNVDENRADAERLLKKVHADVFVHYDPQGRVPEAMGVDAMPTSFLIGKNGRIIAIHKGLTENERGQIEGEITRALTTS